MSKIFTLPHQSIEWAAVPHDFTKQAGGAHNLQLGVYTVEDTQRYVYGTRYITWDGRVYKYGYTTTYGVTPYHACCNKSECAHQYVVSAVDHPVGSRLVSITKTNVAEDRYAGGMLVIYKSTVGQTTHHFIVGNDDSGDTYTNLYLEFPIPASITAASEYYEVYENPYRLLQGAAHNNQWQAWMGVACALAAASKNIWIQTWGPTLISAGNTTLDDAEINERTCFFVGNGTIMEGGAGDVNAGENQIAGYILNAGTPDISGPQIYLMCST